MTVLFVCPNNPVFCEFLPSILLDLLYKRGCCTFFLVQQPLLSEYAHRMASFRVQIVLPGIIHRVRNAILVRRIDFLGSMRFGSVKVDTEVAIEIIIRNRRGPVWHTVHGCCIDPSIVFDQDGSSVPAPSAIDGFERRCIAFCKRFSVQVIRPGPSFALKRFSCFAIFYGKGRTFWDSVCSVLKPVQPLRAIVL